jgi:hypothetical protein
MDKPSSWHPTHQPLPACLPAWLPVCRYLCCLPACLPLVSLTCLAACRLFPSPAMPACLAACRLFPSPAMPACLAACRLFSSPACLPAWLPAACFPHLPCLPAAYFPHLPACQAYDCVCDEAVSALVCGISHMTACCRPDIMQRLKTSGCTLAIIGKCQVRQSAAVLTPTIS